MIGVVLHFPTDLGPFLFSYVRRDVDFLPPFPATVAEYSTHITYLDTTGRPAITLRYKDLTNKHVGVIYVSRLLAGGLWNHSPSRYRRK